MQSTVQSGVEQALERSLERQRWRVDGAKVVVVFAGGAGSTFVTAALQKLGATEMTVASLAVLAVSVALLIASFFADRLHEPDVPGVLAEATLLDWDGELTSTELLVRLYRSVQFNEWIVRLVLGLSLAQVMMAVVASGLAGLAMLSA
ncbi:hypothetical protein GCM10028784_30150 [Myceligenerans cantabricum]